MPVREAMSVVGDRLHPVDRNCIRFGECRQTSVRVCRECIFKESLDFEFFRERA